VAAPHRAFGVHEAITIVGLLIAQPRTVVKSPLSSLPARAQQRAHPGLAQLVELVDGAQHDPALAHRLGRVQTPATSSTPFSTLRLLTRTM
jgi:hypothetical protein